MRQGLNQSSTAQSSIDSDIAYNFNGWYGYIFTTFNASLSSFCMSSMLESYYFQMMDTSQPTMTSVKPELSVYSSSTFSVTVVYNTT